MRIAQKSVIVYRLNVYGLHWLLVFRLKTLKLRFIVVKTSGLKASKRPKGQMLNGVSIFYFSYFFVSLCALNPCNAATQIPRFDVCGKAITAAHRSAGMS